MMRLFISIDFIHQTMFGERIPDLTSKINLQFQNTSEKVEIANAVWTTSENELNGPQFVMLPYISINTQIFKKPQYFDFWRVFNKQYEFIKDKSAIHRAKIIADIVKQFAVIIMTKK